MQLDIKAFFDPATKTFSYVVADVEAAVCAIIDPVADYDAAAGRLTFAGADQLIQYVTQQQWRLDWILETHVHADHVTAAPYIQQQLGGRIAIGEHIDAVQRTFGDLFHAEPEFATDGSQFDHLFKHADTFKLGNIEARVIHTPGHTPACVSFLIDDAVFVGDTLFMPDYGTARCDFPGGDAKQLYQSIQRLFELPDNTRVFMCHDYLPEGRRSYQYETTIAEEKQRNVHIRQPISETEFVDARESKDKTLNKPALIIPSVQINMRAGHLPPAEDNGKVYLKTPLNVL